MWDTTKYAHEVCEVSLPYGVNQQSSIKTYTKSKTSLISKMKYSVSKHLINKQTVDKKISSQADLIYMWGAFPKNSSKPFIIELDNPYTPAYYHIDNFKKNKHKIKEQLDKAYKITYLSETCKDHCIELYGQDMAKKSFVNYPFMGENYKKQINEDNGLINFIFVGLNSRGKGGSELLEAFTHTKNANIRLTFISNVDNELKLKYHNDTRIQILPPQSRDILLNEIYPKMDVMIFPSLYESFGVVLLEALSFGMGIITVNTYATHEIVEDNFNGKLLHHPILKPIKLNNKHIINCVDLRIKEFHNRYLQHNEFYYGLYSELKDSIMDAIQNHKIWKLNSIEKFNNKFSPKIWQENFRNILQ
ncbi:MAG: glycosyltransferase family 4 protein [Arcobacteraceae bacterium]|nr:glycosyltransferase family 4 protein [Arcobacteraceae bacterium]